MERETLAFGLNDRPDDLTCAWGARWIWPNDLVWDRQDAFGPDDDRAALMHWLNGSRGLNAIRPLASALDTAKRMADEGLLRSSENRTVTLYEDERGIVRGNPQGSHGYVYVAAWLKPNH